MCGRPHKPTQAAMARRTVDLLESIRILTSAAETPQEKLMRMRLQVWRPGPAQSPSWARKCSTASGSLLPAELSLAYPKRGRQNGH
jgi:hypothetical protein